MKEKINWYGTYSLILREIYRFCSIYHQTIITPSVSGMIMLFVFIIPVNEANQGMINNIPTVDFITYGVIVMKVIQNSFSNSYSSLLMSKILGYVHDILTPPFSGIEILISLTVGAIARGFTVALCMIIFCLPFIDIHIYNIWYVLLFWLESCCLFGQLGILTGMIVNTFDQGSMIDGYIISPLTLLSGTFYSIDKLPIWLRVINKYNPFYYLIDGFRYSMTGFCSSNISFDLLFISIFNLCLFLY